MTTTCAFPRKMNNCSICVLCFTIPRKFPWIIPVRSRCIFPLWLVIPNFLSWVSLWSYRYYSRALTEKQVLSVLHGSLAFGKTRKNRTNQQQLKSFPFRNSHHLHSNQLWFRNGKVMSEQLQKKVVKYKRPVASMRGSWVRVDRQVLFNTPYTKLKFFTLFLNNSCWECKLCV